MFYIVYCIFKCMFKFRFVIIIKILYYIILIYLHFNYIKKKFQKIYKRYTKSFNIINENIVASKYKS